MKRRCALILACLCLLAAGPAVAQDQQKQVTVTVVDQAGSTVFVEPGESAGLRVGTKVQFGRRTFRVQAVAASSATIAVGSRVLRLGARGRAVVSIASSAKQARRKPASLASFAGQWPDATLPADAQNPTPVPIGRIRRRGATELAIRASSSSLFPLRGGDQVTHVSVRAQLRAEPIADVPFGIDADVEAGRWIGRGLSRDLGADSRPTASVQELRLRYGDRDDPGIGLGRLRYASRAVGLLDGVRMSSPRFGGVSVFGFGGLVPSTLDGAPDTSLARFGAGASYWKLESPWRPSAEITAYGSLFEGELDERRLAGNLRMYPGPASLGAHFELSGFAEDNPWGANRVELTSAGIDAGIAHKRFSLGASLDALQPERSRWLASLLPQSWLCTAEQLPPGSGSEPCSGERNTRYFGLVSTGLDSDHLAVRLGGTTTFDPDLGSEQIGGFVDVHLLELWRKSSLELGTLASRSDFVDSYAVRLGASTTLARDLDAQLYYRPAVLVYEAAVRNLLEHRLGGEVFFAPDPSWGVRLSAEATEGDDVALVGVFATAVWRGAL